ncbi:DUF4214 domain-containing protein [Massilia soli]|uniref:DUF4214 domain-containing protein n=1 Tax=Massilia soli TaxID=2792854 RepID=A0ABS7SQT5_9BURK|nr:DUF4214 domain-containing protein [Massilia soli]MBZ2208302.1 DUF4214 domain-containing protein [Massilia soli]
MTHAADDFPGDSSTTGVLTVGGTLTGRIDREYDSDWVKVDLVAGTSYVFSMPSHPTGLGGFTSFSSTELALRGPGGALLWDQSGSGQFGPTFEYTAKVSGSYFLETRSWNPDAHQYGSYNVAAAIKPAVADDFASNATTAGVLVASGKASGTFEFAGDIDWFRFRAEAGKHYSFGSETVAPFVSPGGMQIFDSNGVEYPIYPFNPSVTGDYYVAVGSHQPGTYSIVSRTLATDDYAGDMSTTAVLRAGADITGAIQFRADTDYIKTTLAAGVAYTFELAAHLSDISALSISLRNAAGEWVPLSQSSPAAGRATLTFTPATAGDYYFVVDGEQLFNGVTRSPYTLKWVRPVAGDDFGDNYANASAVALGATVSGVLDGAGDIDVLKLDLQAGKSYVFEMASGRAGTGVGMAISTVAGGVYSEGGMLLSHTFTPQSSGTYYVSASAGPTGGAFTFKATLETDDFGVTAATAGKLVIGSSVSGKLTSGGGDRDWFGVTLTAGQRYSFTTASADATSFDASVIAKILDSNGNPLASSPSWSLDGLELTFAAATSGKYFFELSAPSGSGAYTIAAKQIPNDDFGHTSATAGRLTEGVSQAGALEVMGDRDSFKLAVTAGNQYVIEVKTRPVADSFGYTDIEVVDGSGVSRVGQGTGDFSLGYQYVVVDATSSGDYLVTMDGAAGGGVGSYAINAYSVGRDDFGSTGSTAGVVAINGQTKGRLEHIFDEDAFKVSLTAGKTYAFELIGVLGGGGTLDTQSGSIFRLLGPDAMRLDTIATEANRGSPYIQFTARETGDYFLLAHGYDKNAGTYTVKATEVVDDTVAPTLAAQWISNGATGVSLTGDFVLTFSEGVKVGGGPILLRTGSGGAIALQAPIETGNKLIMAADATLRAGTTYTLELPVGSVMDYAGNPYAGVKSFTFTTTAIASTATTGNDLMTGFGNGTRIDGGAGIDTAPYAESMANYRVVRNGGDALVVYRNGATGDALTGIERLLFADGAIALDISGNAGQAYRLYQAAFDRAPDHGGLGYWIAQMDRGMALTTVASNFVASDEFRTLYGASPTNAQFVDLLYDNILHRKGEQGGIDFWVNSLANGATRDQVLTGFSESAENQGALASVIGNGFLYQPYG